MFDCTGLDADAARIHQDPSGRYYFRSRYRHDPRDCKFFKWQTPTPGDDESQADSRHSLLVTNARTPVYNTLTSEWALTLVGHAYHGASQREVLDLYDAKHGNVNGN